MFELRWYQTEAVDAILSYRRYKEGKHPLVAIPTGAGKSLIIATVIKRVLEQWPDQRILMLTHQRELVVQNEQELLALWPEAPVGVFSAGLNRREFSPIVFASIQSIYKRGELFAHYNLILVDEAHLIPYKEGSMYRRFFKDVTRPIVGLTATPFRLGTGLLTDGDDALFSEIIYDISQREKFTRLIDEGFLCNLITKRTRTEIDTSEARIRAGEFLPADIKEVTDVEEITNAALDEVVKHTSRKHWLIFAIDIEHAENIGNRLTKLGITNAAVHSRMEEDREQTLNDFVDGKMQAVVNVDILTTGFNHKAIDLIVLLRPTNSPVLHVQMIGRGLRVMPGKENCLVLDFAGNTERLGPINDVQIGAKRKGDGTGKAPTKTCPECMSILHLSIKTCPDCGYVFPQQTKLQTQADDRSVVQRIDMKEPEWHKVDSVFYYRHTKYGKPDSVRVVYRCGTRSFTEWVCFEHTGQAKHKAQRWWRFRTRNNAAPLSTTEALAVLKQVRTPTEIQVNENHPKYPTIAAYRFSSEEGAHGPPVRVASDGDLRRLSQLRRF